MTEKEQKLRDLIASKVLLHASDAYMVTPAGIESNWIFDFRRIFFTAEGLSLAADVFWDRLEKEYPFQVAGLEAAALPLIAAIMMRGIERGKPVNGFFIRKSRNKSGLLNMIEGTPTKERVILVDDLMNQGGTFLRQVKVLERAGIPLHAIFAYVRYRKPEFYSFISEAGARLETPFSLLDFGKELLPDPKRTLPAALFDVDWHITFPGADHFHVVPKSAPALDEKHIYIGSDSGHMRAIRQSDGSEVWKFSIRGFGNMGKTILSSPALHRGVVYFGAYDGNFYALDAATGAPVWTYEDADWIGSSPAVGHDAGLVYVGLEFGLFRKQGGIVALDAKTGVKRWEARFPGLTHGSPAYSARFNMVVIGSNDFGVYAFNAKNGAPLWRMQTAGEVRGGIAIDENKGLVCFGSFDGKMYVLDAKSGKEKWSHRTGAAVYATPVIAGDFLYCASQDKRVYAINVKKFGVSWTFSTNARVFASPIVVGSHVYIGSNDGRFYELDAKTGKREGFFQAVERITTRTAYNRKTRKFFLTTFNNELLCLSRKGNPS